MSASGALRVDTLNGPARQILHAVSSLWNDALLFRWRPLNRKSAKKLPGFCAPAVVVSREKIQSLVVRLTDAVQSFGEPRKSSACHPCRFTTFGGLPTICPAYAENEETRAAGAVEIDAVCDGGFVPNTRADGRGPRATATGGHQGHESAFRAATSQQRRTRGTEQSS